MNPLSVSLISLSAYAVFRPQPDREVGGAEVQFYLLSRELAKDPRFKISLVCRDYGQRDGEIIENVIQRKINQGGRLVRRLKPLRYLASAYGLDQTLRSVGADVNVAFCAGIETGIAARHCRSRGGRLIFMAGSDSHLNGSWEARMKSPIRWAYRYGLRRSDLVICQNDDQINSLKTRFGRDGIILPSACEMPAGYESPSGDYILWVARLTPIKGAEIFLALARSLPGRKFVMVVNTAGDPNYSGQILAEGRGIPNLEIHENLPYQKMDGWFKNARGFVNTSEYEGFPNTFLQSMKFGVPVVSMNVNPSGVLTEHGLGRLCGNAAESLARNVEDLYTKADEYGVMSRKGYEYAKANHELSAVAEMYKKVFLGLTEKRQL